MKLSSISKLFEDPRKKYELFIGLVLLLVLSLLAVTPLWQPFEDLFFDVHFQLRGARPLPAQVAIVSVDEASIDALGRWPWSRDKHAALIDILNHPSFLPKQLVFDMLFEEPDLTSPKSDKDLAYRVDQFKNSVTMAYFFEKSPNSAYVERYERHPEKEKRLEDFSIPDSGQSPEQLEEYQKVSLPFAELSHASRLAFVNTPADSDGRTRRTQLLARYRGKIYPSIDLLTALQFWEAGVKDVTLEKRAIKVKTKSGERRIPVTDKGELLINYYGSSENIPGLSYLSALDSAKAWMQGGSSKTLKFFKDKIVLLGITALGLGDRRTTPFYRYEPGINLHAQTIANILENRYLVRLEKKDSYIALWVLGIWIIAVTMFFPVQRSLLVCAAGLGAYFLFTHLLFRAGWWLDFAMQASAAILIFIAITSFRYFTALQELKRTQDQLIQSVKMASLGELSAGIAHEFRNILNAVNLNVEFVTRPNIPPEKLQRYSEMLKKIMKSSNQILEGLLLFARQSQSVKTPGNLKTTIEDTILLLEKELMRFSINLVVELDEVPEIPFDRGQISQVIMNMTNNSRDALKEREGEKQVRLGLKEEQDFLRIEIADNGSGIPPQVLKRLFQPFVTSKPAGKGTGLGLSVCHGIIKNHGGDIKVKTAENQGTTWFIYLPKTEKV